MSLLKSTNLRPFLLILVLVLSIHTLKPCLSLRFHPGKGLQWLRHLNKWARTAALGASFLIPPSSTSALLTYPLRSDLKNNIVLMKSGESSAEADDVVLTKPVKKTSMSNSLTERGKQQVVEAAINLMGVGFYPSYIWAGITQRSYETATIMAHEFQLGQNRLVPVYSFLDPRAMGIYEGKSLKDSIEEVHKQDELVGISYKPPRGEDETPSESISQVLARDNQLLSTIETMYSGENVLIVSPDSDVLSILMAALNSEEPDSDLPKHGEFQFENAEFRKLIPFVKPIKPLSPEEVDANSRQMRAFRIRGTGEVPSLADDNWFDLWHATSDYS